MMVPATEIGRHLRHLQLLKVPASWIESSPVYPCAPRPGVWQVVLAATPCLQQGLRVAEAAEHPAALPSMTFVWHLARACVYGVQHHACLVTLISGGSSSVIPDLQTGSAIADLQASLGPSDGRKATSACGVAISGAGVAGSASEVASSACGVASSACGVATTACGVACGVVNPVVGEAVISFSLTEMSLAASTWSQALLADHFYLEDFLLAKVIQPSSSLPPTFATLSYSQ